MEQGKEGKGEIENKHIMFIVPEGTRWAVLLFLSTNKPEMVGQNSPLTLITK